MLQMCFRLATAQCLCNNNTPKNSVVVFTSANYILRNVFVPIPLKITGDKVNKKCYLPDPFM